MEVKYWHKDDSQGKAGQAEFRFEADEIDATLFILGYYKQEFPANPVLANIFRAAFELQSRGQKGRIFIEPNGTIN